MSQDSERQTLNDPRRWPKLPTSSRGADTYGGTHNLESNTGVIASLRRSPAGKPGEGYVYHDPKDEVRGF